MSGAPGSLILAPRFHPHPPSSEAAMGIALRQSEPEFAIVDSYYAVAKREPTRRGDLEIARTDAFKSNFLDLVRTLVAKQQSHVVVVAHGNDSGLLMPITD